MSDNDDVLIGRVLTRREVLVLVGTTGAAAFAAACVPNSAASPRAGTPGASATGNGTAGSSAPTAAASGSTAVPSCIVRPALTEGPYFLDQMMNRSDIRTDAAGGAAREGVPLAITFAVSRISGGSCVPFAGAVVDLWHCDALGVYSGVQGNGGTWLRGYQVTDASGNAKFTTIYPGWYQGRAVHIHFKIRSDPNAGAGLEFTSQLFFDESVTSQVYAQAPYARKGQPDVPNSADGIFSQSGGQLTLAPTGNPQQSLASTFEIGVQV